MRPMSIAFMISPEPRIADPGLVRYGMILAGQLRGNPSGESVPECVKVSRFLDQIDAFAEKIGARPLSTFLSATRDELPDYVDADLLPPAEWFSPADALRTIEAILGASSPPTFVERPRATRRTRGGLGPVKASDHTGEVLEELQILAEVLRALQSRGQKFHFFLVE